MASNAALAARTITFIFIPGQDGAAGYARVHGCGWDVTYNGHEDVFSAWAAVNADGFLLAPGASLEIEPGLCTEVTRLESDPAI